MCIFLNGDDKELNEKGFEFYDKVFDELLKYDIELFVIFFYYEILLNFILKYNGWVDCCVIGFFMNYVEIVFKCYKNKVKYWLIFNEINVILFSVYIGGGVFLEDVKNLFEFFY